MRRSRIASATDNGEATEVVSIGDAMTFDVMAPEGSGEETLAHWRVESLEHAPVLLGVTHVLIAATSMILSANAPYASLGDNPFIPAALVAVLDCATAVLVLSRDKVRLAPHNIVRILAGYIVLTTMLWTWFGWTVADDLFVTPDRRRADRHGRRDRHGHDRVDELAAAGDGQHHRVGRGGGRCSPDRR